VFIPQPPILDVVSQKYFCHCLIKGDKNKTKKPQKCPRFKCNTISVSFSACRCSSVAVSSKVGRKKRVWRQFCEWLSEAAAHLPIAVSLLLLEALFMQVSGVSLTLTWPLRLCFLRVLLDHHCYKLSPFQAHWEM
jgi:hypothetical protein